ncbi:MAG: hemerythrin domain-containing protein [Flavobacteriales bacterium]|nr:hemerythrin domain-containing protein [Flavobacteriales bacterium]MBP9078919.1 hemerythrin domain-containing protein [Flavobacteriales bacterium]
MPPIERLPGLRGISREHHEGLLLCWKVRAGLARNVPPARIRQYCRRFLKHTLKPHFEVEEDVLFPVLGYQDPDVRKAMADHRRLQRLINGRSDALVAVSLLEEELEAHIRFEERLLFNRIQLLATPEQLAAIERAHAAMPVHREADPDEDAFWK